MEPDHIFYHHLLIGRIVNADAGLLSKPDEFGPIRGPIHQPASSAPERVAAGNGGGEAGEHGSRGAD